MRSAIYWQAVKVSMPYLRYKQNYSTGMKKIILFLLICISVKVWAQTKPKWELVIDLSAINNSSPQKSTAMGKGAALLDSSGGMVFLPVNISTAYWQAANSIKYKSNFTAGITIGGRMNYSINNRFDISIGATLSLMGVSRTTVGNSTNSWLASAGLNPSDSIFGNTGLGTIRFIATAGNYFSSFNNQVEHFTFTNLNVPISFIYKVEKWRFETGIIPSFIISSSKKKPKNNNDPEIHNNETPFTNNQKVSAGLNIGTNYTVTKELSLGIEYIHGLSSLLDIENNRKLLTRSVSLKLFYKL
jgi:hypothetical protein